MKRLKDMYSNWVETESSHLTKNQQMVIDMMNNLMDHLEDKRVPVLTYTEIKDGFLKQNIAR